MHIIFLSRDDAGNGSVHDEDYSYENVDDILIWKWYFYGMLLYQAHCCQCRVIDIYINYSIRIFISMRLLDFREALAILDKYAWDSWFYIPPYCRCWLCSANAYNTWMANKIVGFFRCSFLSKGLFSFTYIIAVMETVLDSFSEVEFSHSSPLDSFVFSV